MSERAPLYFEARLGGLFPASAKAEEAMREVKGRVRVTISGGAANQRRRGLYWSILALVTPLVNQRYNLTLDEDDLHEITRIKLKMFDEITLPSGEVHRKLWSTSNRAMNEADRAEFTNKALALWSAWTGVDASTLHDEARHAA